MASPETVCARGALDATRTAACLTISSRDLPESSSISFSIPRMLLPQNTKRGLEGVSKYMRILISLWAIQHIKSLMLCKKLVCSSGRQNPPQVQDSNAVLHNELTRNSLHCRASAGCPQPLPHAHFPRHARMLHHSEEHPKHQQQPGIGSRELQASPAYLFRKHWLFHLEAASLLVFYPKRAVRQLDAKKEWT